MNAPVHSCFLIDGRQTKGREYFPVINPADTGETVGQVPAAGKDDVARAIAAAAAAFPAWSNTPLSERIDRLRRAAQAVAGRIEELAPLLVRENGKLLREAQTDIKRAVEALEYACNFAEEFEAPQSLETKEGKFLVVKKPRGVTAVIAPWNFPVVLSFRSLAPALVMGNTAVVKPPSLCPLALTEVIRIVSEHLPPGVVNLVTGKGHARRRGRHQEARAGAGRERPRDPARRHAAGGTVSARHDPRHLHRERPSLLRHQANLRSPIDLPRLSRPVLRRARQDRRGQRLGRKGLDGRDHQPTATARGRRPGARGARARRAGASPGKEAEPGRLGQGLLPPAHDRHRRGSEFLHRPLRAVRARDPGDPVQNDRGGRALGQRYRIRLALFGLDPG